MDDNVCFILVGFFLFIWCRMSEQVPTEKLYYYGNHIVAFLDLLGQKDLLTQLEGISVSGKPEEDREIIQNILKKTVGTILEFRSSFLQYFEAYTNFEPKHTPSPMFEDHFKKMRAKTPINFQSISDSNIFWTPIIIDDEFDYAKILNTINGVLSAASSVLLFFLSLGYPFRGGIELEGGIAILSNGTELYGPALNKAYYLESKIAKHPRIVVGENLISFLKAFENEEIKDPYIREFCRSRVKSCLELTTIDSDGQTIIHFLGKSSKTAVNGVATKDNQITHSALLSRLESFIEQSLERFLNEPGLFERYKNLEAYVNKHKNEWLK